MNTGIMVTKKNRIPLKSRIAAWWMLIVGGIADLFGLIIIAGTSAGLIYFPPDAAIALFIPLFVGVVLFVFYLLPGLLVLKGGRWGWIWGSAILFIAVAVIFGVIIYDIFYWLPPEYIFEARYYYLLLLHLFPIPFLIPLILILLDHISHKLVLLLPILIVIIYFASIIIVKT